MERRMVWILTGPTGAGKSTALRALEHADIEYVDNLPIDLIEGFVALPRPRDAVAVIDARQGDHVRSFEPLPGARVLFLDARDDVLLRRVSESTRPHPARRGKGPDALQAERAMLEQLRGAADVVVDTSELTPKELGERVCEIVGKQSEATRFTCTVSSFGYKYGVPLEADWIIDTRLMTNPFWQPELRSLTGFDPPVRDFVLEQPEARRLLHQLGELLPWAVERYANHNRHYLHVALGCTGGRHRSVVLAEELATKLRQPEVEVEVRHRDVDKPDVR